MNNDTSPSITVDHSSGRTSVVCICRNKTPINTLSWKYDALSGVVGLSQAHNWMGRLSDSSLQSSNQIILKNCRLFSEIHRMRIGLSLPACVAAYHAHDHSCGWTNKQAAASRLSPEHGCRFHLT